MKQQFRQFDWSFIRGSTLLSVGTALGRLLAMGFWLILARVFVPADYGAVQYAITIGGLIAVATQPFGQYVLARYVGSARANCQQLRAVITNGLFFLTALALLSLGLAIPILAALRQLTFEVLLLFAGLTLYYGYWGLATGFTASGQLTAVYVGSNLLQLVMVFIVFWFSDALTPALAAAIYALSYVPVIVALQARWPLPLALSRSDLRLDMLGDLARFSWPIWVSHISYMLYTAIPILLLEYHLFLDALGVFSLANTLTAAFTIINHSIATLFLSRISQAPAGQRRLLLLRTLAVVALLNAVILAGYLLLVQWVVIGLFGVAYAGDLGTYVFLALATIAGGIQLLITAALIGSGNVWLEASARMLQCLVVGVVAWWLVPQQAALGAAIAALAGALAALAFYSLAGIYQRSEPPLGARM
ncbi:MAG: lipopolysaccharide biosynthesis protein [Oscillochloridaceae bacterium]|nr:lipopolysaccharide biosynthesis protein [Chloroflexaceae bacterium]MDW8390716.1 lipopolysaccharide biosynthesis protein [Oscillochloridaceae bacterium]